jgi:signal transduction histidine kinase
MVPGVTEHRSHTSHEDARALLRQSLADRLRRMGIRPAPDLSPDELRRLLDVEAILSQCVRASRHTAGTVRAYASLIADGYAHECNASHWAAKIQRSAQDLEDFAARFGALRVCAKERPTLVEWGDVLNRIASRCGPLGSCTIEASDRSNGPFRQRGELLGRALFQLVRNAVEAAPRGGSVRARVDECRVGTTRVFHVRIADDGPGLADGCDHDAAWRPFVTTKPDHAGLGLAYVAACAPLLGAVAGFRRESDRTAVHWTVAEEGDLAW